MEVPSYLEVPSYVEVPDSADDAMLCGNGISKIRNGKYGSCFTLQYQKLENIIETAAVFVIGIHNYETTKSTKRFKYPHGIPAY